jgi:hypothetical protein
MCDRWEQLNLAFQYLEIRVAQKELQGDRYALELFDLLLVKNFKVGNAVINTPYEDLPAKLHHYSEALSRIAQELPAVFLQDLQPHRIDRLVQLCDELLALKQDDESNIAGFGPALIAALGAAHFPSLIPVLDRNVLIGANICGAEINIEFQGRQVTNLENHFGPLIRFCRNAMMNPPAQLDFDAPPDNLRQLDRALFCIGRAAN